MTDEPHCEAEELCNGTAEPPPEYPVLKLNMPFLPKYKSFPVNDSDLCNKMLQVPGKQKKNTLTKFLYFLVLDNKSASTKIGSSSEGENLKLPLKKLEEENKLEITQ